MNWSITCASSTRPPTSGEGRPGLLVRGEFRLEAGDGHQVCLIDAGGQEIVCHWCGERYQLSPEEIAALDDQGQHAQA